MGQLTVVYVLPPPAYKVGGLIAECPASPKAECSHVGQADWNEVLDVYSSNVATSSCGREQSDGWG